MQGARPVLRDESERRVRRRARNVDARVRRDRHEARERRAVPNVVREHDEAVEGDGFLPHDRDDRRVAAGGDLLCGVGGRRCCDDRGLRQPREQVAALLERARVRAHDADRLKAHVRGTGDDREVALVEEVVRLGDRTGERALDRKHAVRRLGLADGVGDRAEAADRHELRRREERRRSGCGMRPGRAGVHNRSAHGRRGGIRCPQRVH